MHKLYGPTPTLEITVQFSCTRTNRPNGSSQKTGVGEDSLFFCLSQSHKKGYMFTTKGPQGLRVDIFLLENNTCNVFLTPTLWRANVRLPVQINLIPFWFSGRRLTLLWVFVYSERVYHRKENLVHSIEKKLKVAASGIKHINGRNQRSICVIGNTILMRKRNVDYGLPSWQSRFKLDFEVITL